ncbi:MAG: CBS domain-containing protein [Haliscomenobacteraceae bacterium CHB4]|nr:hypothetical protein [Saprospiraceae bacterium]MCE7926327.1 CBS domain-containing protein [Haliscomenobacteraceae bacterium CHB4]
MLQTPVHFWASKTKVIMANSTTVASIMSKPAVTLEGDANLIRVRDAFETHPTHYIPILRGHDFLGIIHKTNFKFFMAGLLLHGDDFAINNFRLERTQAKDIMTTSEDAIPPDTPVETALKIMVEHHFQALPVVQGHTLVGVVTPFDILRAEHQEEPPADPA